MRAWIELSFTSITSFCDFYRGSFSSVCILLKSKSKHTCNFSLPHQLTQLRPQTGRLSATQSTTNLQLAPQQQQTPVRHLNLNLNCKFPFAPTSPRIPIGLPTKQSEKSLDRCRLEHQLGTWGRGSKARKCSPAWSHRLVNGRIVQFHSSRSTFSKAQSTDFLIANAAAASRRRSSLSSSCDSVGVFGVREQEDEGNKDKMSSQPLLATAPGRWTFCFHTKRYGHI